MRFKTGIAYFLVTLIVSVWTVAVLGAPREWAGNRLSGVVSEVTSTYTTKYPVGSQYNVTGPTGTADVYTKTSTTDNVWERAIVTSVPWSAITETPVIPTAHSQLTGTGVNTHSQIDSHLSGTTSEHGGIAPLSHTQAFSTITGSASLAQMASYNTSSVITEGIALSSSGVFTGCLVTKNTDSTKFDMTECFVRFADHTSPLASTASMVTVATQSGHAVTNLATWHGTYIGINAAGGIVEQETMFTREQTRTIVPIAFLFHANHLYIKSVLTHAHSGIDVAARLNDLAHSIGIMNLSGNQYYANGANLKVNKSAGSSHSIGANFQVDKKSPDTTTDPSLTPMPVTPRSYRDGVGGWTQTSFDVLNPNNYDDGTGTLPSVPAGNWVAIPLFYIPGLGTDGARVQYPQRYFATKAEALAELPDPLFVVNPNLENGTIRTYCVVQQGATDLSNTAVAEFVNMGKFSDTTSGGGAAGAGAPTDGEYVTYSANTLLTNERVLNNGTNTEVDTSTAGQVKINVTGIGTMAAQNANNVLITGGTISGATISATPIYAPSGTTSTWGLNANNNLGIVTGTLSAYLAGAERFQMGTTSIRPASAGGMNVGTSALPFGLGWFYSTVSIPTLSIGGSSYTGFGTASQSAVGDFAAASHAQAESTITFSDISTGNTTSARHGYFPKIDGASGQFLKLQSDLTFTWATLAGGGDLLSSNNLSDVASAPTSLSNLIGAYAGNSLKVVRVNTGETDLEYATISVSTPTQLVTMLNVKDFGAVGDGATNDTTAIQNAINAADNGHGGRGVDLFFPEGIYYTSATLTVLGDNIRLIGAGRGSTVIYPNFTTGDIIQFGNGTVSANQQGFMHMQIFAPASHTSGSGINIQYSNDFVLEDFSMSNMFIGVSVGTAANPSLKVTIKDGTINGTYATTGIGIYVLNGLGGDTYITDIVMSNSPAAKPAAGIRVTQAGHVSILRCNITSCAIGLDVNPGASQDVNYLFIDHSLFDSGGTHGARFAPTNATGRIRSIMAVNSWFAGSLVNYGVEIGGVASSTVNALSFIGCRFLNNYQHGIYISYSGATNISFTDCTISGNGQQTINTYDGINAVANVSGVQLTNNTIGMAGTGTNQQRYAVNIAAGTSGEWQVIGNDFSQNGTVGTNGYLNRGILTGYGSQFVLNNPQLSPGMAASRVLATPAINNTNTIISNPTTSYPFFVKANSLAVGTTIRVTVMGTCTSTAANISTFRFYFGANNTTADTLILTAASTAAATSGTNIPFKAVFNIVVRAIGSGTSSTIYGTMLLDNHGVTGIKSSAQPNIVVGTAAGFNSTADGILSVAYQSAAATTTSTFQQVIFEVVKP